MIRKEHVLKPINKEYKSNLNALQVAEEKALLKHANHALFPTIPSEKPINLESRRYIGSKAKLTNWILNIIKQETNNSKTFLDIFAGTACVAKAAFNDYETIMVNDTLLSNNFIYKAFFQSGQWNKEKLEMILYCYNQVDPSEIQENYFSENFGNKFFEYKISKLIGWIRQDIEDRKNELTDKEYSILLTTLIYNIDKVANTVGHYDAYIKKPSRSQSLKLRLIEPIDFSGIKIYQQNANELARKIKADIAYIDPPYNSRQYSRFYHIYETLVKWDKPKLYGVALKPVADNMSVYCTVGAKNTKNIQWENTDYKKHIEKIDLKKTDFVYLDPPYLITFSEYNKCWNEKKEKELITTLDKLNKQNIRFAVSNVTHYKGKVNPIFNKWASNYNIKDVASNYISYHDNSIKNFREVLVTNYE